MKRLAVRASADSIPSAAMQEDHVSMGWSAARKLCLSVDAARHRPARTAATGPVTDAIRDRLRETVPGPSPDRFLSPEIESAVRFVARGGVLS